MDRIRLGLIEEIIRLEESGALSILIDEIKKDIYEEWSLLEDEEQLIKLHHEKIALNRISQKIQGLRNELVKDAEENN